MNRPVSAASTALFRIGFGVVGAVLVVRFFAHGWIERLFLHPPFHFKYPGFSWVTPLPSPWMHVSFAVLGAAAVLIAVGYRHRLGAAVFSIGLAYVELIDRTNFLNHYYWMVLTAGLMVFLPMSQTWSLDARLGRVSSPGWVSRHVVWLLRFQVGMVYFFAGVAKLNPDWLLRAEPLSTWLPARADLPLLGPLLSMPATAFTLAWAGVFFDLTVVVWLLVRRTRAVAYAALVAFHLMTWLLFPSIGVFPLVMGVSAMIFFDPDWPERWLRSVRAQTPIPHRPRPLIAGLAAVYVLAMVLIPLRHLAIPGDVRWTGEGYQGAWQVMLTDKTGAVDFIVTDSRGRSWVAPPPDYLTDRQLAVMATDPALIQQLAMEMAATTGLDVSARGRISFNGRMSTEYTDPGVELTAGPLAASDWLRPAP